MKMRLRDRLPLDLRKRSRRIIVRLVRYVIYVTKDVLNIATTNGLDLQREWNRKEEWNWHDQPEPAETPEVSLPWSAQDFLFLMDLVTREKKPTSQANENVQCSIIIPAFNKVRYTFQCLRSLIHELDSNQEIIVVNNGSTDETERLLSYMKNRVRVVNNTHNAGFVNACNQGAAIARGRFLVFLNNDTVVQPGWLQQLIETIESDAECGAVGSMLLYPDGRLQEAGGVVWKDGDAANYGRGGNPEDRKFRFAREVDYCSAASLLVRTDLFERLGGFDERYSPAFYEDTDLCFSVRAHGYKVLYQPMSRVVHHEGATAGTDLQDGYKQYQSINRGKFVEKWRNTLDREQMEASPANLEEAANRQRGPHVLFFDHCVPTPDKDSGSLRTFEILKSLARVARPVFVPLHISLSSKYEDLLGKHGVEVVPQDGYKQLVKSRRFQIAVLSRVAVADEIFTTIRKLDPNVKIVFDTVDLHFLRLAREYQHTGDDRFARESELVKTQEKRLAEQSDQVWCVTPEDKQMLEKEVPGASVRIIPNIHTDHERVNGFENRTDLLFVGNFHHRPNKDALSFYVRDILPRVRKLLPNTRLHVVGSNMSNEIFSAACEDVIVVGYVPDLTPLLQNKRLLIAPLRFGAGMKGKVGQALSHGLPVITTTIGAEGFGLTHGLDAMIADDPEEFAQDVYRAYTDEDLWHQLSEGGRRHVQQTLSPDVVSQKLHEAIAGLVG